MVLFGFILLTSNIFAQFHEDTEKLSKMSYMKYAENVNCEYSEGTSLELRICLNLEFQEIDSILNIRFNRLLEETTNKKLKKRYIKYQKRWIEHRRLQSKIASEGYRGHMFGIRYMGTMVMITKNRTEEIEYLIK